MALRQTLHPQINEVLRLFEEETHPFSKIHRMIDLFEIIIKTHTAVIIADYFRIKNISDEIKGLLAEGLITPSLGMWQVFNRVIMEDLAVPKSLAPEEYEVILDSLDKNQRKVFSSLYSIKDNSYIITPQLSAKNRSFLLKCAEKNHFKFSAPLFLKDFYPYFFEWDSNISSEISLGGKKLPNPIQLRNRYAHGSTPDPKVCQQDISDYLPLLEKLLQAEWLHNTAIVVFRKRHGQISRVPLASATLPCSFEGLNKETVEGNTELKPGIPYLLNDRGELLSLFPILTYKNINLPQSSLLFFNDLKKLKNNEVSLLNYPNAYHLSDAEIYEDFLAVINVLEWRNKVPEDFKERIEELTNTFQGRLHEQEAIRNFIEVENKGFFFLFGSPGIGKSAMLANVIREYKYSSNREPSEELKNKTYIVEYFIRRNSTFDNPFKLLDSLNSQLEKLCRTRIPMGNTLEEKRDSLDQRLRFISSNPKDKKIIICIDGLDEGIQNQLHEYLVTQSYSNVLFVYSSRLIPEIESLYLKLSVEEKRKIVLEGLNTEDIRSLLYKVTNKYELINNPSIVDLILEKSSGNPLYLKLLCSELESHSISVSNLNRLPARIEDFYEEILQRLKHEVDGTNLLHTLYVLAAARDFLSARQLELITGIDTVKIEKILDKLYEVLYENPAERCSYQLFHESFREYLLQTRKNYVRDAEWNILQYCEKWQELNYFSEAIQVYPLKYFSKHLLQLNMADRLYALVEDQSYLEAQIQKNKQYLFSFQMYLDAMQLPDNDAGHMLSITVKLAQLHRRISNMVPGLISLAHSAEDKTSYVLEQVLLFKSAEQFLLYIHLLYHTLKNSLLIKEEKIKRLNEIIRHYDENSDTNIIGFKWCDYMSLTFMVRLLGQIRELGADVTPFLQRSDLQNLDNEVIEYELKAFDLTDGDYYSICSSLFLVNLYQPCLKSWIILLCSQGLFEAALEAADRISIPDIKVDALVHIAEYLELAGKPQQSQQIFSRAEQLANEITPQFLKVSAFSALAQRFHKLSKAQDAKDRLTLTCSLSLEITDLRNRSYALREAAIAMSCINGPEEALAFVSSKVMDNWNKGISLNQIILDLYRTGQLDEMEHQLELTRKLIAQTIDYRDKRYLIRLLAITLGKLGRTQEALQLLQEANEVWNALRVLRSIANHLGEKNLEDEILEVSQIQTDVHLRLLLHSGMVTAKSLSNSLEEAQAIYEAFSLNMAGEKAGNRGVAMANIHSSVMRPEPAEVLPGEGIEIAAKIEQEPDEGIKPVLLAYLSTGLAKGGWLSEAEDAMDRAKQLAYEIANPHNQAYALCEISREYSRQGLFQLALGMTRQIPYLWNITPALRQIAHELARVEEYSKLFSIVKEQKESISILVMMDEISQVLKPSGFESLLSFLKEEIYSEVIKTHTYDGLILRMNDWKEAVNFEAMLLRLIPEITYSKDLVGKCLLAYYEHLKKTSSSSETTKEFQKKLDGLVKLPEEEQPMEFAYHKVEDWIGNISDEDDLLLINQLIKRVKSNKLTEDQFKIMISDLLDLED